MQVLFFADCPNPPHRGSGIITRHWVRTADGKPFQFDANFVNNLPAKDIVTNGDADWWPTDDGAAEPTADYANKSLGRYINPDSCRAAW